MRGGATATVRAGSLVIRVDSVIYLDQNVDVCLLAVAPSGLTAAQTAHTLPPIGSRVVAIGNPRGFDLTVSEGIVSGYRTFGSGPPVIQHTAAMSAGSSGGALFDERGKLIGLTTFIYSEGQSLNFAVSAETIAQTVNRARTAAPVSLTEMAARSVAAADADARTAIRAMDPIRIERAAANLRELAPDDPRVLVCTGVAALCRHEFNPALDHLTAAVRALGDIDASWARTARMFLALTVVDAMKEGHPVASRGATVQTIDAFLATQPPSLVDSADDAAAVAAVAASRAALTNLEGKWSDVDVALRIFKSTEPCDLKADGPDQMRLSCNFRSEYGTSVVSGILSRVKAGLSGHITITHLVTTSLSTDICEVQAEVSLQPIPDWDTLTGKLSFAAMRGRTLPSKPSNGLDTGRSVLCSVLPQTGTERVLTLRRVE